MGLLRRFWTPFFAKPSGLIGQVGARLLTSMKAKFYRSMAAELDLQADDELLDVGCGSAKFFTEHAGHVRYVAGLDASEIQVEMARKRLAERIAGGTAEIVLGDAADLPWEGSRFSVVTSIDAMKFLPDPEGALAEMHRVLRPGGRAVITMGDDSRARVGSAPSGTRNAFGIWCWSDADAARLVEEAGFVDVTVSVLPVLSKSQLVRATKPESSGIDETTETTVPVEEVVA
jgi:SAM-dependent methyltransferase